MLTEMGTAPAEAPEPTANSQLLAREEALTRARCRCTAPVPAAKPCEHREKEDAIEATTRDDTFHLPEAVALFWQVQSVS